MKQNGHVVERLVIAHHEIRFAGLHVLAPAHLELELGVLHDFPAPALEAVVAFFFGDAVQRGVDHGRPADREGFVDVPEGERQALALGSL